MPKVLPEMPQYLWRAILVFLMAPIIVWVLIATSEYLAKPNGSVIIPSFDAALPSGDSLGSAPLGARGFYKLGDSDTLDVIMTTNIGPLLDDYERPSLLIQRVSRDVDAEMDGLPLSETGGVTGVRIYKYFEPHLYIFPEAERFPSGARKGDLTLRITDATPKPRLRTTYVGEAEDLLFAYRWRSMIGVNIVIAAAAISFMSALISFALLLSSERKRLMFSFGVMTICWMVVCLDYAGIFSMLPMQVARMAYTLAIFTIIVFSFDFVNNWTFENKMIRHKLVPWVGISLALLMVPAFMGDVRTYNIVILAADAISALVVVVMLSQLFWYLATQSKVPWVESGVFLVHILAVITDITMYALPTVAFALWPDTGVTLHYGPMLSLALGLTIISRFVRNAIAVQTRLRTANAELSTELAAREAEISRVYAERADQMREAALMEERKRIMRDMHDGVGGRLLSLSLRAKGGALEAEALTEELDSSMQELRLIVDSMDTADGDLDLALGALRGRIEPLLFNGGVSLSWDAQELGYQPSYGPREVLSLYRLVQEAASNIIRHAKASHMTFCSRLIGDEAILIEIIDDGIGIASDHALHGNGLSNIKARAESLGGVAEIGPRLDGQSGVRIAVRLPQSPQA